MYTILMYTSTQLRLSRSGCMIVVDDKLNGRTVRIEPGFGPVCLVTWDRGRCLARVFIGTWGHRGGDPLPQEVQAWLAAMEGYLWDFWQSLSGDLPPGEIDPPATGG